MKVIFRKLIEISISGHTPQKRLEIEIIEAALSVTGLHLTKNGNHNTFYGNILTFFLFIMLTGMAVELFYQYLELEILLNSLAYIFLTIYAIIKRMTLFQNRQTIQKFLTAINNSFKYDHKDIFTTQEIKEKKIRLFRHIKIGMLILFGCGCTSPFIQLVFGESMDMSIKLYPMHVPWNVNSLPVYVGTNLLMITLLTSSMTTIYSTIVLIVFSMIYFNEEFQRMGEAIKNIEQKTNNNLDTNPGELKNEPRSVLHQISYEQHFKKFIQHYQEIVR